MSYYDNGSQWSAPGRQSSWEQPPPPSRSGASSTVQQSEPTAFGAQFEEVDRAADNLMKSGKMFGASGASSGGGPPRRDSMPSIAARGYPDFGEALTSPRNPSGPRLTGGDPRMGGPQRHHSVSEYDGLRSHSASNVQGYYASQRFGPRSNEADQMMQAKRRMAAQRERELRNYHQEQQYNRNLSGGKSDRSLSPNAMSEEERRELIARQHRALYGDSSTLYANEGGQRTSSQDARVATTAAGRNPSPLAFDPFGTQAQGGNSDGAVQMPPRDQMSSKDAASGTQRSRANSTSSPSSNPTASFTLYENTQQSSRTSNSSPGGSPPRQGPKTSTSGGVAPIGTRPAQTQGQSNKRSTTPLPSPLSYGFSASEQQNNNSNSNNSNNNSSSSNNNNSNNNTNNERSTSTSSNPPSSVADKGVGLGWGSNSGVWGSSKNTLGVQASVWG